MQEIVLHVIDAPKFFLLKHEGGGKRMEEDAEFSMLFQMKWFENKNLMFPKRLYVNCLHSFLGKKIGLNSSNNKAL